jgi:hypothetical protein
MPYLRISEARTAGQTVRSYVSKSASQILTEDARRFSPSDRYDVFLSHAYKDGEVILGVKSLIEAQGLTVYVDWIDDAGLDRGKVTRNTAKVLRERMRVSSCLVYAYSPNAGESLWMPWELGYFDGFKPSFVWILPLVSESDSEFKGQEYLGLYPPVEKIAAIGGRMNFGFPHFGEDGVDFPLTKAAKGSGGVHFVVK